MSIDIVPYSGQHAAEWDSFCETGLQATLLHTRRFLSYHGERLTDRSVLIKDAGRTVGLFPAANDPTDTTCVVSHPGATYGGIIQQRALIGEPMIHAIQALRSYYGSMGAERIVYKAVPAMYHKSPAYDDIYALFRAGAVRTRCDLSSTIDLSARLRVSERRRRGLKKAVSAGVQILSGPHHLDSFWTVLTENLERKHGARPVHTVAEMHTLQDRFPKEILVLVATLEGHVEAGTILFRGASWDHAQYIASSQRGYEVCALDAVFEHSIHLATSANKRWFDFGISTEDRGTVLNEGLYRFKSEFGSGGTVYEHYQICCKER